MIDRSLRIGMFTLAICTILSACSLKRDSTVTVITNATIIDTYTGTKTLSDIFLPYFKSECPLFTQDAVSREYAIAWIIHIRRFRCNTINFYDFYFATLKSLYAFGTNVVTAKIKPINLLT